MVKSSLIAFYGGTFDPIHYGHLEAVTALARLTNLQKVIFLPNNMPPHRPCPKASAVQRLAMTSLAIAQTSATLLSIDNRELYRTGPSWTVETFESLRQEYGPHVSLGLVIGQDSLLTLPLWHRSHDLLSLCHLLVCTRPGYNNKIVGCEGDGGDWVSERLTDDIAALYRQPAGLIFLAVTPVLAISASEIRQRYREGRSCNNLLPSVLQNYIEQQELYR